ncbi:MAG TPA: 1,4-alpha-glucan branching protein GlgB, partial [Nannocystis sp.]
MTPPPKSSRKATATTPTPAKSNPTPVAQPAKPAPAAQSPAPSSPAATSQTAAQVKAGEAAPPITDSTTQATVTQTVTSPPVTPTVSQTQVTRPTTRPEDQTARAATPIAHALRDALTKGLSKVPHGILGPHPITQDGEPGIVVRAFHPNAITVECVLEAGPRLPLHHEGGGLFSAFLPGASSTLRYHLRFEFPFGDPWEHADPYRFAPTIGPLDLHLLGEGNHHRLWEVLGAHPRVLDGYTGTAFAVWAPNAQRVSVVGDFCAWDGRLFPMRELGAGFFEIFIPDVHPGTLYKYELITREGLIRVKTDPCAASLEAPPSTASRIVRSDTYTWGDAEWMQARRRQADPTRQPMAVYEVHLGSWAHEPTPDGKTRPLTYHELAARLPAYVKRLGFTHIEVLPVAEHPFTGSWGYQVSGYFAPTARFGDPDGLRHFVDACHQHGLGVILDWVPAHFPKDDFALRRFDGTALYEHEDPRLGEHPDWGTLIFNFGRPEVRNFLIANALYWLEVFHFDALRVDAVASMLHLDYSRQPGQWLRNRLGGRENLEAIDFLKSLNTVIRTDQPGCFTIAEESTSFPHVTGRPEDGGLGFTFKWNMGWMHDTLDYFSKDPIYRSHLHDKLTFGMMYEYSERFVMPLSHDEVVHLKRSLVEKMPGDEWQRFANVRALLAYQYTRPGKKLLFMGSELGVPTEWNHDKGLDWDLLKDPMRAALHQYIARLGELYRDLPALWRGDPDPQAFAWLDVHERERSILAYMRSDGDDHVIVVLNL